MPTAIRFRLFHAGRYPTEWTQAASEPGVLLAQEGIPVTSISTALRLPGRNRTSGRRKLVGSLVIRPDHLRVSLGPLILSDHRLDATGTAAAIDSGTGTTHAAVVYLEPAGVRIHIEVAHLVHPGGGTAEIVYHAPLGPEVLGRLVSQSCVLDPTPVTAQRLSVRL
ncbi:hypothetical protein ABIB25_000821 [Nakamurella sp. UYEF19]|uniref:hypothetical protein n=1 Tax=Nakamurella sp. UYEF19 TaxID=1756392 RepID=UPI003395E08B